MAINVGIDFYLLIKHATKEKEQAASSGAA